MSKEVQWLKYIVEKYGVTNNGNYCGPPLPPHIKLAMATIIKSKEDLRI